MDYTIKFTPYQGAGPTPAGGEFSVSIKSSRLEYIESRIGKLLKAFQRKKGPILVTMFANDEPFHEPEDVYELVAEHIQSHPEEENHAVYYAFDSDHQKFSTEMCNDTASSAMKKKGSVCERCKNICQSCITEYAPRIRRDSTLFGGYALPHSKDEEVNRDAWSSMTDSMFTIINRLTSKCARKCGPVDIRKYVNHHLNNRNSALKTNTMTQSLWDKMQCQAEEWLRKYGTLRDCGRIASPSLAQRWAKEVDDADLQVPSGIRTTSAEPIGLTEVQEANVEENLDRCINDDQACVPLVTNVCGAHLIDELPSVQEITPERNEDTRPTTEQFNQQQPSDSFDISDSESDERFDDVSQATENETMSQVFAPLHEARQRTTCIATSLNPRNKGKENESAVQKLIREAKAAGKKEGQQAAAAKLKEQKRQWVMKEKDNRSDNRKKRRTKGRKQSNPQQVREQGCYEKVRLSFNGSKSSRRSRLANLQES